jgi:hypothetical protein
MTTTDRTPEELAYQRANIAAGLGDPYAEQAHPASPAPGPVCPECGTDSWDFTSNDQASCANGHSWTQPVEDDQASPTPVADALTELDRFYAGREHIKPYLRSDYAELVELRKLAAAVRSHGIGAELGQLREQRQLTDTLSDISDALQDACAAPEETLARIERALARNTG